MNHRIFKNLFLSLTIACVALFAINTSAADGEPKKVEKTFPLAQHQRDLMLRHLTSSYYLSGAPYNKGIIFSENKERFINTHWLDVRVVLPNMNKVLTEDRIVLPAGNYHQFLIRLYPSVMKNGKQILPSGFYIGIENINIDQMTGRWQSGRGVSFQGPVPGNPNKQFAKVVGSPGDLYLLVREVKPDTCHLPDRPEDAGKYCGAVWGDPAIIIKVNPLILDEPPTKHAQASMPNSTDADVEVNSAGFPSAKK